MRGIQHHEAVVGVGAALTLLPSFSLNAFQRLLSLVFIFSVSFEDLVLIRPPCQEPFLSDSVIVDISKLPANDEQGRVSHVLAALPRQLQFIKSNGVGASVDFLPI